ncbi:MAG: Hsp20/alpha crystallin family protein [Halothiobacillaceae bacterium]
MTPKRYEPWSMLNQLYREMDHMFQPRIMGGDDQQTMDQPRADWSPAVDIKEEESQYVLHMDIPGVDGKNIHVTAEDGVLEIKGERNSEMKSSQEGYTRVERSHGSFLRRFNLPDGVDVDGIGARCEHGVLTLVLPKTQARQPRRIAVE